MYDILIIGKSLAGTLTALMLKKHLPKLNIAIIDQSPAHSMVVDQRATALSLSSIQLLKELNLWEDNLYSLAAPIQEIHIGMDTTVPATLLFKQDHHVLGYNLSNQNLRAALKEKLDAIEEIDVYHGVSLKHIEIKSSSVQITLENDVQLQGHLLIGADGRQSRVRTLLSSAKYIDYQQTAITGTVQHSAAHNNRAFEFFIPQGALALIPLADSNTSTLVWSLKNNVLPIDDVNFDMILSTLMQKHLGDIRCISLEYYPLKAAIANPRTGHRWVLVGDSANAIHPVAGQGMNLAIRDIKTLVQRIVYQYQLGLDIGSLMYLKQYAQERQFDRYSLLGVTHSAAQWLTTSHSVIRKTLSKGMSYLNRQSVLSLFMIETAQFGLTSHTN
jgi:ubiquinone biosynthesis UbiH/UbiF/VisC/COQ6 family hydroxylase